uniref:Asparagine synthetase [glutamine-hydrolyzing] n=1 Tax=Syphacia muris TaxID=451379 RepID=A0A0N5APE8_9BILA
MCGIWALLGGHLSEAHKSEFLKIAGRGPDLTVLVNVQPEAYLGFHRLAIVEPGNTASVQPIVYNDLSVVCNGELYNHKDLKSKCPLEGIQNGASDCAAIIHAFTLFKQDLRQTCASLDGVFAFLMADKHNLYIGRDPIGVRPLFYGYSATGDFLIGSEVKCVEKLCENVHYFPPGCCATIPIAAESRKLNIIRYYVLPTLADRLLPANVAQSMIKDTLINAVSKRLMGNRQFGFMLSGGLDSSLVASIASRMLKECRPIAFSVGFEDSPDIENARAVAKFLDIEHRVLVITPEQCIKAIPEVIYALETFEPFIVRCGIAHYLLCKHIAETSNVKVLLSGEGADELFGSYAYMQRAPSTAHLHQEIIRRMNFLHYYDVLRCDRATSCHGLEIRVPFLDKKFIDLVIRLPASCKLAPNQIEKHLLRSAFDGWLPDEVLWRSKEGFSEALGKTDLGEIVTDFVNSIISDQQFEEQIKQYPIRTPENKEELWYRILFESLYSFPKVESTIHTKVYRYFAF